MLIGYVRVSKADGAQTLEPQRDALLAAGIDPSRIYQDLASGRHDARPGLIACLKALQPRNTLVIWKLDPSFRWTPMLAFRSWRGVSDECSTPGVSGIVQAGGR